MSQDDGTGAAQVHARRFDADRTDEVLELDAALARRPSERQLLWLDVRGEMPEDLVTRLAKAFDLDASTAAELAVPGDGPMIRVHGDFMRITVVAAVRGRLSQRGDHLPRRTDRISRRAR